MRSDSPREWKRLGKSVFFGAPLFVHWTVLVPVVVTAVVAISNPVFGALFLGSYLGIIVTHELGHAYVARRLGYRVDSIGITLLHGWCVYEAPDTEWDEVLVAWGGVAAQFAVALPIVLVTLALGDRDWSYFTPVAVFLGYFNLGLAVINLVPGDDSDGNVAWRLVPLLLQKRRARKARPARRGSK